MRIVDDAHRDTSAFALDTRTEYSGCLAEDGSPRPRPNAFAIGAPGVVPIHRRSALECRAGGASTPDATKAAVWPNFVFTELSAIARV